MLKRTLFLSAVAVLVAGILGCDPPLVKVDQAQLVAKPGVEAKANETLYLAGAYLKECKTFRFRADITRDEMYEDGLHVQFGGRCEVSVKRPNMFRAVFDGDERHRRSWFDGETMTIYSVNRNLFAQAKISGTIDQALDHVFDTFGFTTPLADLLYADPYNVLIENVEKGYYIGVGFVDGVSCHHLAFRQEAVDWEVWIEVGDRPLLRKVNITYKNEADAPQYTAVLSNWQLNPVIGDGEFIFRSPADAEEIEFLPLRLQPEVIEKIEASKAEED